MQKELTGPAIGSGQRQPVIDGPARIENNNDNNNANRALLFSFSSREVD